MGKSNKKAKSDRINALRQQYDAFLEEDKKRKERNQYILGRLDKMRISTALMPVRYKPVLDARPTAVNYLGHQTEAPSVSTLDRLLINQIKLFQNNQIKNIEDTGLIQEISKKYILIPKLRSPFPNNYVMQNVNPNEILNTTQTIPSFQKTVEIKDSNVQNEKNTDWKSKYEILNLLKNVEKQAADTQNSYKDVSESNVKERESLLKNNREQVVVYNDTLQTDVQVEQSLNTFPEKDLPEHTLLHYDIKTQFEKDPKDAVFSNLIQDTNITYSEYNQNLTKNDGQTDTTNDKLQDTKLEYKHKPNTGTLEDVSCNNETQPTYNANMVAMADFYNETNINTHTENGIVENKYPGELNFSIHNDDVSVKQQLFGKSEQVVYHPDNAASYIVTEKEHSTEVSLAQDFQANKVAQMKADPKVNPEEQTDIPINPMQQIEPAIEQIEPTIQPMEPVIDQMENPTDNISESIEDFNAEQRDMFYSEQTEDTYHQGDTYNMDYSQNVYQQNEGYDYYEGTQSEAYPIDLNDQVETQRYDPTYEQQYSDSDQGIVKQMEQPTQHYQQPAGNQSEPDLEMLQFEQPMESEKQIEEALDIEDGYIARQHTKEADEKLHVVEHVELEKHNIRASEEVMG